MLYIKYIIIVAAIFNVNAYSKEPSNLTYKYNEIARRLYPGIFIPGSEGHKKMLEMEETLKKRNSSIDNLPDKPLIVASLAAMVMNISPSPIDRLTIKFENGGVPIENAYVYENSWDTILILNKKGVDTIYKSSLSEETKDVVGYSYSLDLYAKELKRRSNEEHKADMAKKLEERKRLETQSLTQVNNSLNYINFASPYVTDYMGSRYAPENQIRRSAQIVPQASQAGPQIAQPQQGLVLQQQQRMALQQAEIIAKQRKIERDLRFAEEDMQWKMQEIQSQKWKMEQAEQRQKAELEQLRAELLRRQSIR